MLLKSLIDSFRCKTELYKNILKSRIAAIVQRHTQVHFVIHNLFLLNNNKIYHNYRLIWKKKLKSVPLTDGNSLAIIQQWAVNQWFIKIQLNQHWDDRNGLWSFVKFIFTSYSYEHLFSFCWIRFEKQMKLVFVWFFLSHHHLCGHRHSVCPWHSF